MHVSRNEKRRKINDIGIIIMQREFPLFLMQFRAFARYF